MTVPDPQYESQTPKAGDPDPAASAGPQFVQGEASVMKTMTISKPKYKMHEIVYYEAKPLRGMLPFHIKKIMYNLEKNCWQYGTEESDGYWTYLDENEIRTDS